MNRLILRVMLPALAGLLILGAVSRSAVKAEPKLAHMVFFTLKDRSPESRAAFVASCKKYLTGHDGTVSLSFGTIAEDVKEPVSVRDFDVALHLIFENKDFNAKYQAHPRHKQFVEENKEKFAQVRVFDTYLAAE
jgi:hypothetical protein